MAGIGDHFAPEYTIKRIKSMLPTELHQKIMTLEEKKATDLIEEKLLPLVNNYLSHLLSAASKYNSNINPEESNTQKIEITDSASPDYKIIAKKV
ncbi:MAG: hypothetical protein UZ19_OD1000434 [Parcubacteria bacterium OLB19]|nr:MAG: hypothetical protein UZ19_OD1000434 [Parcubacteria bacterium OLB19]